MKGSTKPLWLRLSPSWASYEKEHILKEMELIVNSFHVLTCLFGIVLSWCPEFHSPDTASVLTSTPKNREDLLTTSLRKQGWSKCEISSHNNKLTIN